MLDMKLPNTTVMCLETGRRLVYTGMSLREALVIAYVQTVLGDFRTWEYQRHIDRYGPLVEVSKSGRTAALRFGAHTFSSVIQ
jgi:hypothetical protein